MIAKSQFVFFNCRLLLNASFLASSSTVSGISLSDSLIKNGTIIKSSNNPITGMKSGIKSIGLNKYPAVIPIRIFALAGVLLSLYAIINTCTSDFNSFAFSFSLCITFIKSQVCRRRIEAAILETKIIERG